jgi:putative transposase
MRAHGLQGIPQRRRWQKKGSGQRPAAIGKHLARYFAAEQPNPKWLPTSPTRTAESWLYLCVVIDLYPGLVVGWSTSPRQERELVAGRNDRALATAGSNLHSDRRCQFTSDEY